MGAWQSPGWSARGRSLFHGQGLAEQGVGHSFGSPGVPAMLSGPNGFLPAPHFRPPGGEARNLGWGSPLRVEGPHRGREGKAPMS